MAIDYSLESKQGKLFVNAAGKAPVSAEDIALLKLLGVSGLPTAPIPLKSSHALDILAKLARTGRLKIGGQKILFDPFTELDLQIEIRAEGDQFRAEGMLLERDRKDPLHKAAAILPTLPPCVLRGPLLQKLSRDVRFAWLERLYPAATLNREELERWREELREEGEEAPHAIFPNLEEKKQEVWPILKLKDRFGAFADLWLDYGAKGEIAFHEPQASWRDTQAEKFWEKDLLETGFQAKIVDSSHYYCPMDKVASSLSFLLDIGWKILDFEGRRVIRQKDIQLQLEEERTCLSLRGKVHFGEHEIDVKEVAGAFQRREKFLELSSNTIGLIDSAAFPAEMDAFQIEEGRLTMSKTRFALMKELLPQGGLREALALAEGTEMGTIEPAPEFSGTLHPYQKQGLKWLSLLQKQGLSGLLADEMGLGKTVQVLALLSLLRESPILIVAPTSLLFHWQRECEKFLPGRALYVHSGSSRKSSLEGEEAIVTSYALLRQDRELFAERSYSCVILDEAQVIKNPDSQIAGIVCTLKSQFRLAISGTPIENRAEDLWSIFRFLLPELLGERNEFRAKIAAGEVDRRYIEKTKKLIAPFILRRKKELVADQLPPKLEQIVWVEMQEDQRHFYESMVAQNRKESASGTLGRMEILEKILRLRQICCHPALLDGSVNTSGKMERLLEDLEEIIEEGASVLIYSQFTSMLAFIRNEVKMRDWKMVYLDGSTKDREAVVRQFQEDPETKIFLISLKAGGVGLNLTKADYVLLFDPWWNEAVERQAIDRAHRLGRKAPVIARRYVTALSIEEKMMRLKEHKTNLMGDLLEDMEAGEGITMDELRQLLD